MNAAASSSPGGTVLVIDDDADMRDILMRTLGNAGYRVLTAETGALGLATAAAQAVDVILLDVMMPGMDGLAVCAELRTHERTRSVPVILLTAKDDVATRAAGMRLGVSEYVTKPVNLHELLSRVRSQLHARQIRAQLDASAERLGALTGEKTAG
jgi:DNA-binding response OmpR family regulator